MQSVAWEVTSRVGVVALDRPETRNSVDEPSLRALKTVLERMLSDTGVRAVVLTGKGDCFCSGVNLKSESADTADTGSVRAFIADVVNPIIGLIRHAPKPVIAAVNGPAIGFGVALAIACDIVLAARSASFALSFVKVGAVLDGGASFQVARSIGEARARAIALLGMPVSAQQAEQWGLIWQTVDAEALQEAALALAEALASGSAHAIATIKRQLAAAHGQAPAALLEAEAALQAEAFSGPDFREALGAYQEKRPPRFPD